MTMHPTSATRRGAVLIVVLGVLVVLALMATTFAGLTTVERKISRNYLDIVRARLAAQAGVEYAISELQGAGSRLLQGRVGPQPTPWKYWGQDDNEESMTASGAVNIPLAEATNPSLAIENDADPLDPDPTPRAVVVDKQVRGISGTFQSGYYGSNTEVYSLRIADSSSRIYLNDGITHVQGNQSPISRNLARILNQLGAVSTININNLGTRILQNRPAGGFGSLQALKSFLTAAEFRRVQDFVTVNAWTDRNVALPVPFNQKQTNALANRYGINYYRSSSSGSLYRYGSSGGRGYSNGYAGTQGTLFSATLEVSGSPENIVPTVDPQSLLHAVYAFDELNPVWIEVAERAPVNVNAASREVLIALLSDLQGVFMSDRRRNNMATTQVGWYHAVRVQHTYEPGPSLRSGDSWTTDDAGYPPEGDEIGFLYQTLPIVGPASGSGSSGISAALIAEEFIACRDRLPCATVHAANDTPVSHVSIDYSTLSLGGPFRNWRQFNAFCDNLVRSRVLQDSRKIFFDHNPNLAAADIGPRAITGPTPLIESPYQQELASQALADLLKANFNPNLHLNELNPDRNLHLLVDKTDLIINSTEFIFTPTGHFEIESLGRVLRPDSGTDALAPGMNNAVVAEAEVNTGVRLFDLHRETHQKDFMRGTCSALTSAPPAPFSTNNALSLEVGPEPDNGPAPRENEWGGYIALPTVGGTGDAAPGATPQGTPAGSAEFLDETIHTHLSRDFDAHYHLDGSNKRSDLGSATLTGENTENFPDPSEENIGGSTFRGPYDPTDGPMGRYRLARSFRMPASGGSVALPTLQRSAVSDLRIDGGYIERHSGLAYWASPSSWAANTAQMKGVASYWVKPSFDPSRSGKPRMYLNASRASIHHGTYFWGQNNWMHIFSAGHDYTPNAAPLTEVTPDWSEFQWWAPNAKDFGIVATRSESHYFGVGYGSASGIPGSFYYSFYMTPSVNHAAHQHPSATESLFEAHRWTHFQLRWEREPAARDIYQYVKDISPRRYEIMVNGRSFASNEGHYAAYTGPTIGAGDQNCDWSKDQHGHLNPIRIGSPSRMCPSYAHYDNFSPDSTVDEVFIWNKVTDTLVSQVRSAFWAAGRYSIPRSAPEGEFTSAPLPFQSCEGRACAVAGGSTVSDPPPTPASARIIGASWTWYGEETDTTNPALPGILYDYSSDLASRPFHPKIEPKVELALSSGPTTTPWSDVDGFTPLDVTVDSATPARYKIRVTVPARLETILLASPVIDDVTIYTSCAHLHFTGYSSVQVAN